jgi:hypothetical protein
MRPRLALFLGRSLWIRTDGEWHHESLVGGVDLIARASERLIGLLSLSVAEEMILVFEPEGMSHQLVQTPKVSRRVFASLERVRSDHPVVASENLGWGIEYPESGPSGEFLTQLHSELTPGLRRLYDACSRQGTRLVAAWSAYTAAAACLSSRSLPRVRFVLLLTVDFFAIVACGGGKRSFRSWVGPMSDRDWKAFSVLIGDFEAHPSPSMGDGELRRGTIVVVADGDPGPICPIWDDLRSSGRIEKVMEIEEFGSNIARIPLSHPANLTEAFPRPLELDRYLMAGAIAGLIAALALGSATLIGARQIRTFEELEAAHIAELQRRVDELGRNQREMEHLKDEAPETPAAASVGHESLVGLASAVPDPLTLTSFTMRRDGSFELEAMIVGTGFNAEDARQTFTRYGFKPSAGEGWVLDNAAGTLVVRGNYRSSRQ